MKVSELREAEFNPRVMSEAQLQILKDNLANLGDLGGIVFNRRTGNLVGGHQRLKALKEIAPGGDVVIEESFGEPNGQGTTARGHILHQGEKFAYREVDWDEQTERIANIAANNVHGGWDVGKLTDLVKELACDGDISALTATGFSQNALDAIIYGSAGLEDILRREDVSKLSIDLEELSTPDVEIVTDAILAEKELDENIETAHTCPKCGYKFS